MEALRPTDTLKPTRGFSRLFTAGALLVPLVLQGPTSCDEVQPGTRPPAGHSQEANSSHTAPPTQRHIENFACDHLAITRHRDHTDFTAVPRDPATVPSDAHLVLTVQFEGGPQIQNRAFSDLTGTIDTGHRVASAYASIATQFTSMDCNVERG